MTRTRYINIIIFIVPVVESPTFLVQYRHFAIIHKRILLSPETTTKYYILA